MDGERGISPASEDNTTSTSSSASTTMSTQMRSMKKERGGSMGSYRVSVIICSIGINSRWDLGLFKFNIKWYLMGIPEINAFC